jgi:beta-1,4-mannosyl-glycoprotein beta-1,4-N-acetylglucosaminyltransferase
MIYDIVSYFNEIELLRLRLKSLKGLVDCFVIVESDTTHTGSPKDFSLIEHIIELSRDYNIRYVQHSGDQFPNTPWINENSQRNYALNDLSFEPEDIIMISDVDEIPSPRFIKTVQRSNHNGVFISIQELSFFWPNLRSSQQPMWMGGTRAVRWKNSLNIDSFKSPYGDTFIKAINEGFTLTKLRLVDRGRPVLNGGWHLSYYGGLERVAIKLSAFAHSELNERRTSDERIARFMEDGMGFFADEKYSVFGSYLEDNLLDKPPDNFGSAGIKTRLISAGYGLYYYIKILMKYYGKM